MRQRGEPALARAALGRGEEDAAGGGTLYGGLAIGSGTILRMAGRTSALGCLILCLCSCAKLPQPAPVIQTQPTTAAVGHPLAQPPLRSLLDWLVAHHVSGAQNATVFSLSGWFMYDHVGEENEPDRPRFEGSPIQYDGVRVFLTIGPIGILRKNKLPPPPQDLVVRSTSEDGKPVVTLILAGQRWSLGFAMDEENAAVREKVTALLREWMEEWRGG